jgi:uncharacterized repeat protein (TIGR04076 family)
MTDNKIKCVAVEVRNESGICSGSAKCKLNETYILTGRTPDHGMCGRAYASIHPMAFAMRWTEKMTWEKSDTIDVLCPDGCVVYRLTRIKE